MERATPTVEAYLEFIYLIAVEGQPVIGARLAESLHVSRPSVTATLKRMVRDGLVKVNARKEIQFTPKGQALAEYLQRRHCVIERWLTDELGMDWADSDAQAHQLEHAMSDQVAELLNKHLGTPTTCPHGNPIPGNVKSVVAVNSKLFPLSRAREGDRVIVTRVSEYDAEVAEILNYLGGRGVRPGAKLELIKFEPFEGPVNLKVGSQVVAIGRKVASYVWVKKAE